MPSLADFERDYWAPDREQVLAQMRAEQATPIYAPPGSTWGSPGSEDWRDSPTGRPGGGPAITEGDLDFSGAFDPGWGIENPRWGGGWNTPGQPVYGVGGALYGQGGPRGYMEFPGGWMEMAPPPSPWESQRRTPQQAELINFEQNYWAPDREQVLAQMRQTREPTQGPVYMGPGGSFQGGGWGYGGQGAFDESALEQAWLSSGGRTPQDLANFFAKNPQLVGGAKLVGSKKDKIQLPNGQVIDAVLASGEGGRGAQWLREGGGGGGGGGYGGSLGGRAPNPTPFNYAPFQRPGEFAYEEWKPPETVGDFNDPGYTARLREGQKALERSAAARGTLLTGGTLKDLSQFAQDYAANEYQNAYNRSLQEYGTNRANEFQNYQTNYENALNAYKTNFETQFQPWKEGYNQAYQSWLGNFNAANQGFQNQLAKENQRYGQLYGLAGLGLQATNQQAGYGAGYAGNLANLYGGYGNAMSELETGKGNAAASGQVGAANAWGNAFGNMGNAAMGWGMYSGLMNQPQGGPVWDWSKAGVKL